MHRTAAALTPRWRPTRRPSKTTKARRKAAMGGRVSTANVAAAAKVQLDMGERSGSEAQG